MLQMSTTQLNNNNKVLREAVPDINPSVAM